MVLAKLIGRAPKEGEMERVNLAAVERGRRMTAADFLTVTRSGHDFTRRLAAIWQQVDIILTPALAGPARELGAFPMDHDDVVLHVARMLRFAPFTATFNVTGDPALVAPVALSSERLPLGVQLVAPLGGDALVLQLGAQLMDALPFRPASEAIIAGL
jgi:amidase